MSEIVPEDISDKLSVKIDQFEGPLDLLLELIKTNEMDITNIRISEITEQYLNYLNQMKSLKLEVAGEFLVVAATLLLIKSKTLLPVEEDEEEEEGGEDPRAELVMKLMEYQAFKEAAHDLGDKQADRARVFTRNISDYYFKDLSPEDAGIDTFNANLYDLMQAFAKVVQSIGKDTFHEVFAEIVTIDEKIDHIKRIFESKKEFYFTELFKGKSSRNELIVTFLSILELSKRKFLMVEQTKQHDDILLKKRLDEISEQKLTLEEV
jgi:segregation and condensation protein A